jgi:UDP-N-acetylmuramoyl-L-alanyl-D-glutamate--2,6-diaminopimelate ligase
MTTKTKYSYVKQQVKKLLPQSVFAAIEPAGHLLEASAYSLRHGMPAKKMRVIGVTGTNGKTTTSFMIHRMLVESGIKAGLMTTVAYGVGDDITPQIEHMTSVPPSVLNKRLAAMQKAGVEWLVLETTSHALAQHRVWGVPYEIAVVTNVTHEHLDYHGSFEKYRAAKKKLFTRAGKNPRGFAIVNADDEAFEDYVAAAGRGESYGLKDGDLRAKNIQLGSDGSKYTAEIGDDTYAIQCHIPGEFNVYNSLAAVAVGRRVGLTEKQIEQGIDALKTVEGRMNTIDEGQAFSVIVDFAHTPDAFERLLGDLRNSTKGKLVAVFGSAGRRDEAKRAIQGEIAGKYCDEVILTEEDDRDIDGNEILGQIAEGAERSGKIRERDLFLVLDRPSAIQFAMTRVSSADDTVILLGKGHEKTIERADGEHPWDELEEARTALRKISKTAS